MGKNRLWKRILVYLMTFMMVFSTMPGNVWQAMALTAADGGTRSDEAKNELQIGDHYRVDQEDGTTGSDRITKGESTSVDDSNYDEDEDNTDWRVWVDKTIAPADPIKENIFNITLTVKTKDAIKEIVKPVNSAVVLVIDASSSMDRPFPGYNDRLHAAKTAAKNFIDQYAGLNNGKRMISVVYFYEDSVRALNWTDLRNVDDELDSTNVAAAKNSIDRIPADKSGTNIEAGLLSAKDLLGSSAISDCTVKNVILLSDGAPSEYVYTYNTNSDSSAVYGNGTITSGTKTSNGGYDIPNRTTDSHKDHVGTAAIAKHIRNDLGIEISSVFCGDKNEDLLCSCTKKTTAYLGEISNKVIEAYEGNTLLKAFESFYESIKVKTEAWKGTDPMGTNTLLGNVLTQEVAGVTKVDNSISWNLLETSPEVKEENGQTVYEYSVTYQVKLDTLAEEFNFETWYATNNPTKLDYYFVDENGNSEGDESIYFNIPSIQGYKGGYYELMKVKEVDGQYVGLEGATFTLTHDCPAGCDEAWSRKYVSDSDGYVRMEKIPSGHKYKLVETKSPNGFIGNKQEHVLEVKYGLVYVDGELNKELTVVNRPIPTTDIEGTKVWDDNNNAAGKRPSSIKVQLLANGDVKETVTVTADDDWKFRFENLPLCDEDENDITYSVKEVLPNDNYVASITGNAQSGYTITNKLDEKVTVSGTKSWTNDRNSIRPSSIKLTLYGNGQKVTGITNPITVNKIQNNSSWGYSFEPVPKYDENGVEIKYTVIENEVDNYYPSYNGNNITNTFSYNTLDIPVRKIWVDGDNQDRKRPSEIVVTLKGTYNGGKTAVEKEAKLNNDNNWSYVFTDLDETKRENRKDYEINYTVTEKLSSEAAQYYEQSGGYDQASKSYVFVNTYIPEVTEATVKKVWNDADDQDGKRPESLTVTLSNGAAVTLSEDNKWTATVENLPKYANGQEIVYTWTEGSMPEGYELTDTSKNGTITTLTNSYTPELTEATVKKVWNDADNQDGKRPAELKVTLSNGTKVTLNEENNWTAKVENLPKYADGEEIVYTWTEDEKALPEGYELTDTSKDGTITTLTNSYTPELTEATVKKVWNDAENQDGNRPTELKVTLSNGTEVTLNAENDWTATVDKLPKFKDGEVIEYTWTEGEMPEGYELKNTVVDGTITTLTNSYSPEETEATVHKVWNDADDQDGKRPESLTVTLSNGTEVTLNAENDWTATVKNLPKFKDGKEITYSWTEGEMPEGYSLTSTSKNGTITTLTNSYTPEETEATVRKVWDDDSNRDNKRPEELEVTLSNGTKVTLNEENNWTATVTGLPKYDDGVEIAYTWTEETLPEGYTLSEVSKDGTITTLTNTHTPELTSTTVKKVWDDNNNQDGIRPQEIGVILLANGAGIDKTFVLNDENGWTVTADNLLKYAGGKEIEYTWKEASVSDGYTVKDVSKNGVVTTITNSHTPEETEATIKKVWDDANNQDGKRPESLNVILSDGTEVTLDENNGWEATVTDLPKYADGVEIVYTWTEGRMPEGYTLTDSKVNGTVTTLTNSYDTEETEATIKKIWDDAENQDGKRPASLKVTLSNGTEVTLNENNDWETTVADLPKYADGVEIEYTWTEDESGLPEGYELTDTTKNGTITTLTNSYTPEETEATIKKVWDDANNQDGKRPESLKVTISDDTEVTLNENNGWEATVTGLPKYADGEEIEYTWTEDENGLPEGYELTDTSKNGTITTLTNSYTPETTEATVKKVWDDNNNQDGKRPEALTVTLSDGTEVTLNEDNGWEATVTDLPKYADGVEIVYTWTEGSLPEGYTLTDTSVNGTVTTLTNSYDTEKTAATVRKVWEDSNNQDGKRPAEIIVTLSNGQEVALNTGNNWEATVTDLPKYADGEEIVYTWIEGEMPEGYSLTNTAKEGTVTTLTNSYTPELTEATIQKVWDDAENQDGKRPERLAVTLSNGTEVTLNEANEWTATVTGLPKYEDGVEIVYTWTEGSLPVGYELTDTSKNGTITTLTNSYTPEETEATVKKVWNDADNQDGKRPASLKVTLSNGTEVTLNEANNWKATVKDLPKYANGQEIEYTWTEEGLTEGYKLTDTSVNGTVTTLTNSHTPEVTEATIQKIWDDYDNNDGKRPISLTVTLYSNGTKVKDIVLDSDCDWAATVKDLPKYADGEEIVYTWTEDLTVEDYAFSNYETEGTTTKITNIYPVKETVDVTIQKVWDDANNQDGKRPENLTVTLSNGAEVVLNADNNWTAKVENLPKYVDGKEIKYSWTETSVEGYKLTDTSVKGTVTTLTNKHTPELTEATIKKVWDDANNQDGKRPTELKVTLSNGTKVTLNEANNWTAKVENLPKYADGEEIEYTWTEVSVEDYELTDSSEDGTVTTLTNTHTPEETEATIKKVWNDANDQDGKRPDELTVTLSNGTKVTLNAKNDWTAKVENLPKYADGEEIEYSWTEASVEGYELTDTSKDGTITTLTNTHTPEETEATIQKVWDDAKNQDGIRPASLTVTLSNGTEVVLNADNNWTAKVEKLPKYADGEEIEYTWTEVSVEDYELTDSSVDGTVTTLTNTHTPELTEATIQKVWDDAENQDGIRPASLTVTLSNGTEVALNEANEWTATVDNLPKYADGEEIEYTWTEASVEGYELTDTSKDGTITTLTNTHTPEETEATVKKVWDDADDQDGKRPDELKVTLSDGTKVTLNEENDWTATVKNLPVYKDGGKEIEYSWTEENLTNGYVLTSTSTEGTITTLTNSYKPEIREAAIKKVWDDANDQDGKRPESLTVTLSNGTEVVLNADNEWTAKVENLPVYKDGGQVIEYTWTEGDIPEGYTLTDTSVNGTITTLTNSYTPEETEATIKKVWDDADDQDGKRPDSLVATLSNGTSVTLNEENGWTAKVENLPKFKDGGVEIEYTWTEGDMPEGYELTDTSVDGTVTTLTNSHTPEETEAIVTKVWDDADNQDGIRPAELTVTLSNGTEVVLNTENEWTVTVENLPKYKDGGVEIEYSWTEASVEGYELTGNSKEGKVTTLTNTHAPAETAATVTKVWDDADNQDGIRPAELTVTLSNGTEVILNEANAWSATVTDLPKYKDGGVEIEYSWTETSVEGYELTDTSAEGTVTTLTNTHTPEETEATVTKVWDDADNQDGKRPAELTVTLSNGTEVTLNEANGWTATVENLPKYEDGGKEIVYTWTEGEMPEGYELTATSSEGTVTTLTNSYKPEVREATVTKIWDDADNQDGIRPAELTVTLSNGTEDVETVTLSEENQWSATVENLPVYNAGEKIVYTWTEASVEGYELTDTAENGTITLLTNSHVPETTELTVYKNWKDKHDKYDTRPEEITVYLEADGEIVQTVQITEADKWRYTFSELPKYADGEEIVYTISEEPVDGYNTDIEDMTITNTINHDELDDFADTGDDSKPWAYGFAAMMAMLTAAGTLFFRRKED